jgi:hypothetical protein
MANQILAATAKPATPDTPQYHLPEAHRQAILQQSAFAQMQNLIERQRQDFMRQHGGCAFGQHTAKK